jgi:hypothetical protein
MTKTVTRYTQPCVQTQPGLEFKVAEVDLFEDPNGKWVRYDDIKHLLQDEPKADPQFPWGVNKDMTYVPTEEFQAMKAELEALRNAVNRPGES